MGLRAEGRLAKGLSLQVQGGHSIPGLLQTASSGAGMVQLERMGGCGL